MHKQDNSIWAIKCIDKASLAPDDEEALQIEVEVLQMVDHKNIVKLREVFDCHKTFYMVMEQMSGGELFDRIVEKAKYTEAEARKVVVTLAKALKYCHGLGVVHRDLKPENLLYASTDEDADIKIADFGLAKLLKDDSTMQTACGTPGYVAPEILEGKQYGESVDMWSLGVIAYILYVVSSYLRLSYHLISCSLCGFPPFYDENNAALFAAIKAGQYDFPSPYWDCVSDQAKDFIGKLLVVEPNDRYTADDILKHPWITLGDVPDQPLTHFSDEMKRFNARRRLRRGIMAAKAITGMARAFESTGGK